MEEISGDITEESMLASIEVATILDIQVRTVRLYARTGLLPASQVADPSRRASGGGIQYLFRLGDILDYMAKRDEQAKKPAMTNAERASKYYYSKRKAANAAAREKEQT